jgi:hypothetical protein
MKALYAQCTPQLQGLFGDQVRHALARATDSCLPFVVNVRRCRRQRR